MVHTGRQAFLAVVAVLTFLSGTGAQENRRVEDGTARMGDIVQASAPGENIRQIWAYADPKDGRHMIVCGMVSFPSTNTSYGYVYTSADAGATWQRTLLDDATRFVSEESCTYGNGGHAYFVDGQSDTSTGQPRHEWGHLQVFISDDHGMTWKPAGRRDFVDWTMLAALPADKSHAESLVIFGNTTTDKPGHWWEKRPLALQATDGAQRLSAPVPAPVTSLANFGGGSAVLPDRTALFTVSVLDPKYAKDPNHGGQLNLFAYKASDHSLELRKILRSEPNRIIGLHASVVRDTRGRFPGRLFAAWLESASHPGSEAQLWLATSDDNGYRWSSRPILLLTDYRTPAGCPTDLLNVPPDIRIALNPAGELGILWEVDGQSLLFATSNDGGRTFRSGQLVAHQPRGDLSVDGAVPFNERMLAEILSVIHGKPRENLLSLADLTHLGLSVRLRKQHGLGDFSLTADAKGSFHTFWAGIGTDGHYALMTRTIDATSTTGATGPVLTNASSASTCGEDTAHLQPDGLSVVPLDLVGETDVSESLNLQVGHVEYAADSHIVAVRITVMNKTENILRGPLLLFGVGAHSDFGVATPLNANGTKQGQPFWDLSNAIPADGLPPKASSKPIELRFKINEFQSVPTGDAVAMKVQVFTGHAAQSSVQTH